MQEEIFPRPTLLRNVGFWLLAMLLGSLVLLLQPALTGTSRSNASVLVLVVELAAAMSLAALPLLLPLLPWALGAGSVGLRWLRVFTLQSAVLGELVALGYRLAGGSGPGNFGGVAPLIGTVYFGAGLLAAAVVYRPWLWGQPGPTR